MRRECHACNHSRAAGPKPTAAARFDNDQFDYQLFICVVCVYTAAAADAICSFTNHHAIAAKYRERFCARKSVALNAPAVGRVTRMRSRARCPPPRRCFCFFSPFGSVCVCKRKFCACTHRLEGARSLARWRTDMKR